MHLLNPVSRAQYLESLFTVRRSGTLLSVGTHILNTNFTPDDSDNYTTTSATVLINVIKSNWSLQTGTMEVHFKEI